MLLSKSNLKVVVNDISLAGFTLKQHLSYAPSLKALSSQKWDYVVLQEQSQLLSFHNRDRISIPYFKEFQKLIEQCGAKPIVYQTWAYRDGDIIPSGVDDFFSMQTRLDKGFDLLCQVTGMPLLPVGSAFRVYRQSHPSVNLWTKDGHHPNEEGAYLAACVIFVTLFQEMPPILISFNGMSVDALKDMHELAGQYLLKKTKEVTTQELSSTSSNHIDSNDTHTLKGITILGNKKWATFSNRHVLIHEYIGNYVILEILPSAVVVSDGFGKKMVKIGESVD